MAEFLDPETDLPKVDADTLNKERLSVEEAVAVQLQEELAALEANNPPPETGEPEEEPERPEDTPPVEADTAAVPTEEVEEPEEADDGLEYVFMYEDTPITADEAEKGYMRQQAFTAKTQELSETRQQLEQFRQQLAQEREHYIDGLKRAKQLDEAMFDEPDWRLIQHDPELYRKARIQWDEALERREAIQEEIEAAQDDQRKEQQALLQSTIQREAELALEKFPEWREEAKAQQWKSEATEYLRSYGFDDGTIDGIIDHRLMLVLRDAIAGKAATSNGQAPVAKKKVVKARRGLGSKGRRPGPSQDEARIAAMQDRIGQKGASIDDAIALQMAEMGLEYTEDLK